MMKLKSEMLIALKRAAGKKTDTAKLMKKAVNI